MGNMKVKGKALKITLISLFILMAISSIGAMAYVKMTYDQSFSRIEKTDPKYAGYLTYRDVEDYQRTKIEFTSGENVLKGHLYGEENDKGLVVISPGLGFGSENYLPETLWFVDQGWRVFTFDNTGTHDSEGESTVGPSQSLLDLKAALSYIRSHDELNHLQVMLYGHSWGAYAVTAILSDSFEISAVASISGFNSPRELLEEQADRELGLFSPLVHPILGIYQDILFGKTSRITATDAINSTDIPVMIIHGTKDEAISYDGAGIIAHQIEITNSHVVYKTCSEENHGGHNNLFEADSASRYIKEKNLEFKDLYDSYHGTIPEDILLKYYEGVDRFQSSELDADFMNEITLFFDKQLKN